jgi:hypothetical protein
MQTFVVVIEYLWRPDRVARLRFCTAVHSMGQGRVTDVVQAETSLGVLAGR